MVTLIPKNVEIAISKSFSAGAEGEKRLLERNMPQKCTYILETEQWLRYSTSAKVIPDKIQVKYFGLIHFTSKIIVSDDCDSEWKTQMDTFY